MMRTCAEYRADHSLVSSALGRRSVRHGVTRRLFLLWDPCRPRDDQRTGDRARSGGAPLSVWGGEFCDPTTLSFQLCEEGFGLLEVHGRKAFRKPGIDPCQQLLCLMPLALLLPQPTQAHRRT